jgi:hypothetical protein
MSSSMVQEGLLTPFKVNRPLTKREIADRLLPDKPCDVEPQDLLGVIRMNSTFLEIRDKFFLEKGLWTFWGLFCLLVCPIFAFFLPSLFMTDWPTSSELERQAVLRGLLSVVVFLAVGWLFWFTRLRKECFRYTHYPIRFNRLTRKVHVFQPDGTVMTEDWEKLYFTLCKNSHGGDWEVRGHRLTEDGKTVLKTFALSYMGWRGDERLLAQWEFVRRYMEKGPDEALLLAISHVNNIADRRETYWHGVRTLLANLGPSMVMVSFVMTPFASLFAIGRWICMRTCKIPRWPQEIIGTCQYDENDPYLVDAAHLLEWVYC